MTIDLDRIAKDHDAASRRSHAMKGRRRRPSVVVPMQFHNGTPCIPWCGYINKGGYGVLTVNGKRMVAHRAIYQNVKGPVPAGLVLDHLCRNRCCVNPDHLEIVTDRENIMRGVSIVAVLAQKTNCPKGHAYTDSNTYWKKSGSRECRACETARNRRRKAIALALRSARRALRVKRSPVVHLAHRFPARWGGILTLACGRANQLTVTDRIDAATCRSCLHVAKAGNFKKPTAAEMAEDVDE